MGRGLPFHSVLYPLSNGGWVAAQDGEGLVFSPLIISSLKLVFLDFNQGSVSHLLCLQNLGLSKMIVISHLTRRWTLVFSSLYYFGYCYIHSDDAFVKLQVWAYSPCKTALSSGADCKFKGPQGHFHFRLAGCKFRLSQAHCKVW